MYESANDTADGNFTIRAYVDDDDRYKDQYPKWVTTGRRLLLAPAYEFLYKQSYEDIVMLCADDVIFRTKGWDTRVKELQPRDNIFVVSFDDLGRPRKENGHPFIGRKFIEAMGFLCYPGLKHSTIDNWIVRVARACDRFFQAEGIIEHMHPKYDKAKTDRTYEENHQEVRHQDGNIYRTIGKKEIEEASQRIRLSMVRK
jgi:hypothetical protein